MNALFKHVSLPIKLLIIGLIPLAFAINLGIGLYLEKDENLTILDNYIDRIHQSVNLSRLIDNLQKERNFTFEYALNRTSRDEMLQVRPKTDSVLKELSQTHDSSLHKFPLYTNLDRLQSIRQMTDSGTLQTNQVIDYYSNMIFRLNTLNSVNLVSFPDLAAAYSQMAAQRLLSEMITYLGIINANIYNVFYTKRFVLETLLGTYGAYQIYKSYEEEYLTKAGTDAIRAYNDLKATTSLGATTVYLDTVFKRYALDSTYNHRTWNEASSSGIDELRNLQMSMISDVEKKINEVFADEEAGKRNMFILLIVISILVLAMVFFITREISHTLKELKLSAQKIAAGNTDIHQVITAPGFDWC